MTSRAQAPTPRVSPLCQPREGLRVELCFGAAEALEELDDPFVALGDAGRVSRVLSGRIALGDSALLDLAFKVQRDVVLASTSGFGNTTLCNPEIESIWEREVRNLSRAESPHVVELFGSPDSWTFGPTTLCKKTRLYFHPVSPQTRERLTVCKDDELLRACGLQPYSSGTVRYLFSPTAATGPRTAERPLVFYTQHPPGEEYPNAGVEIRRGTELYRDLSRVVRARDADFGDGTSAAPAIPCTVCAFRDECFPANSGADETIRAESRLVPLTYYDSPVVPLEICHLRYDELVDVLGGADWADVEPRVHGPLGAGRQSISGPMAQALSGSRQYFSVAADRGQRALEILRLKLGAFGQLCEGLLAVHASTGEPCFDVAPNDVMARWCGPDGGVPARWRFDVKLVDLGAAQPFRPPAAGLRASPDVWVPVADVDRRFVSPLVGRSNLGRDFVMRFTAQDVGRDEAGQTLRLQGRTSGTTLAGVEVGDWFQIQLNTVVRQLNGLDLMARVTRGDVRVVDVVVALPDSVNADDWSMPFTFDGIAVAYPRLGVPCDLHGLGMLLFRSLLVNDGQEFAGVAEKLRRVVERFELELSGIDEPDASYANMTMRRLLREEGKGFGAAEIVFDARERTDPAVEAAIPGTLWQELLLFGFRLTTATPGFSYALHHADYDAEDPAELMRRVRGDFERFLTRVDVELFGRAARDHELSALCESRMLEIGQELLDSRLSTNVGDRASTEEGAR